MQTQVPQIESVKRSTFDVEECATYLGVSVDLTYKLVREKKIPHFRVGRRILFKKEKLDQWVEEQMI